MAPSVKSGQTSTRTSVQTSSTHILKAVQQYTGIPVLRDRDRRVSGLPGQSANQISKVPVWLETSIKNDTEGD